jgi:hypothetical protein
MERQFYTYLPCKPNGEVFYVGKGTGKRSHEFYGRNDCHSKIVQKYGKDNILVCVFKCGSEQQAFSDEIQHIAQLRKEGYDLANFTDGGEGSSGRIISEETRLKRSASMRGLKNSLGYKFTDEQRKHQSETTRGRTRSLDARRKSSIAQLGEKNHMYGKHLSVEHKAKIIEWNSIKIECPHCNKVGGRVVMKRWHFDNCKYNININKQKD